MTMLRTYAQLLPDNPYLQLPTDPVAQEAYVNTVASADMLWNKYIQDEVRFVLHSLTDAQKQIVDAQNQIASLEMELTDLRANCDHKFVYKTSSQYECEWCKAIHMGSKPPKK